MDTPPFWPAPYPFRDFLVYMERDDALAHRMESIRDSAGRLGMDLSSIDRRGHYTTHLVAAGAGSSTLLLSGIAQSGGTFYFGQDSVPDTDGISSALGEDVGIFTFVEADARGVTVGQDFFGCGILFHFSTPDFLVVSNRYHLLLLFLAWIGHKGQLDGAKVMANLFSNGTFFHQNVTHGMDIAGVRQLRLDEEIVIDGSGWRIKAKKPVREALAGATDVSREELVRRGKAEVLENVRSAVESGQFTKIVTDLSGGMDSRSVFAAILNIEQARAKTELRTNDVPGSRDLEIAAGLKNLFGMRFYADEGRAQLPLSATDALNLWRSYFMGTYHRVGSSSWSPQGRNLHELRLSGGCGEVLRTFWTKIYMKSIGDATSAADVAARIVGASASKSARACGAADRVADLLRSELEDLPGDDGIEKLENHYLFFRNRYHFGMRAMETFYDSPMWFPLMSKSLFTAARSLAPLDRGNALLLELTERLHPVLIWIDYDSVAVPDNQLLSSIRLSDPRFKGCHVALDTDTNEWHDVQKANRAKLIGSRFPMDDDFNRGWREYDNRVRDDALKAAAELEAMVAEQDKPMVQALMADITEFVENPRLRTQFFSKLSSLRDQAAIFS